MGVPLTTLTQQPVQYNTFHFGGDDTSEGKSGLSGTIVQWDLHEKDDVFKTFIVFVVKKAFAFLDRFCLGTCLFGIHGLQGKLEECEYYQTGPGRNAQARMQIVTAFSGETVCRSIPVVQLAPADFEHYLKLGDQYFHRGQWAVQGEDPAGRKFAAMRVTDRTNGQVHVFTVHQRYRETCITANGGGSVWTTNIDNDQQMVRVGTQSACEFIQKLRASHHERFTIAPK